MMLRGQLELPPRCLAEAGVFALLLNLTQGRDRAGPVRRERSGPDRA